MWLAIHLPGLPIEVYDRALSDPLPLAVGAGGRLVAVNDAAAALGLAPGQTPGAARTLVADLRVLPRRPRAERDALHTLAAWAFGFSDQVSLAGGDTDADRAGARALAAPTPALVFEAARSLHLFGGPVALHQRVADGLVALGWRARVVLAPTPAGALLLAAAGHHGLLADYDALRQALGPLPPTVLDLDRQAAADLTAMGIHGIGALLRLPRAGLALRLGLDRVRAIERLLGERPDPRPVFAPPARFRARLELPAEVPDAASLAFACRRLLDDLGAFLRARQGAVQRLAWRLEHADGPPTRLDLGTARPERDPARWAALLGERLDRLTLPAPVRAIVLASEPVRPLPAQPAALAGLPMADARASAGAPVGAPVGALAGALADARAEAKAGAPATVRTGAPPRPDPAVLDRLRARLGDDAVRGLALVPDHRPERAQRWTTPGTAADAAPPDRGQHDPVQGAGRLDRPLWLLPTPQPLPVRDRRPWYQGPLDLGRGCERIDTGWWDGQPVARDYYVATTLTGERLWVFRELGADRRWYLHGLFG